MVPVPSAPLLGAYSEKKTGLVRCPSDAIARPAGYTPRSYAANDRLYGEGGAPGHNPRRTCTDLHGHTRTGWNWRGPGRAATVRVCPCSSV